MTKGCVRQLIGSCNKKPHKTKNQSMWMNRRLHPISKIPLETDTRKTHHHASSTTPPCASKTSPCIIQNSPSTSQTSKCAARHPGHIGHYAQREAGTGSGSPGLRPVARRPRAAGTKSDAANPVSHQCVQRTEGHNCRHTGGFANQLACVL